MEGKWEEDRVERVRGHPFFIHYCSGLHAWVTALCECVCVCVCVCLCVCLSLSGDIRRKIL